MMGLVKETGLDLKLGLVQTAYANGSSTDYITNTLVGSDNTMVVFCCNYGFK